jgi:phage tail sheath protein FI
MAIPTFTTPGVFVQEIPVFSPSVAAVATAIPAFMGFTEKAIVNGQPWPFTSSEPAPPVRITSFMEFQELFGGPFGEDFTINVTDALVGGQNVRTIATSIASPSKFKMYYSLQMYFANGGGPCYIVSVNKYTGATFSSITGFTDSFTKLEKEDEPTLILFPDAVNLDLSGTSTPDLYGALVAASLAHCAKMQDRFTITDIPENNVSLTQVNEFRAAIGANNLKYGASYMPFLNTILNFGIDETNSTIVYTGTLQPALNGMSLGAVKTTFPAVYTAIINQTNTVHVVCPPSGAIAGIYAAVDNDRGVWKAPANVSVNNVTSPTIAITELQQGYLNVDPTSGKSINAIRAFVGRGILVWGSRTLDGNSNEWRYVPVRRLFIMVEESIKKATEPVVFEANDKNTWLRVKGTITNFLTDLWRQGALAGDKPEQAFFVKIGLNETMTAQDILEGKLIVQVGMAAVRPAEFIVLQFMHKLQEA